MKTTAIEASFVQGRRLITGVHGFAGELAHVQVAPDGHRYMCGNRGCLSTESLVLPRLEIVNGSVRMPAPNPDGDVRPGGCRAVPLPEYLPKLGTLVGQALAPIISAYDPDCMVVDAGLGQWAEHFISAVTTELERRCPPPVTERLAVVPGELDDAERSGALALADAHASALLAAP